MHFQASFPAAAPAHVSLRALDPLHPEVAPLAFHLARHGDAEALAHLLDAGLPASLEGEEGESLLLLACEGGHFDAAALLLEHGADPQARDAAGRTPLALAAASGDAGLVRLLLDHGAAEESAGH